MIKTNNISKVYKCNSQEVTALRKVNINFQSGKMYAIVGHSGSGKSTLLHILGLLDTQTTGTLKIDGNIISKNTKEKEKEIIRSKNIGFVFQQFYLNNELRAFENVMMPMYINKNIKAKDRKKLAIELLEELGLENRINHFPKQLSSGEQQRVAIARALANNPKIILADEPTGNLDKDTEKKIFTYLKKLVHKGCCIIVATHSEFINNYADEIISIDEGVVT